MSLDPAIAEEAVDSAASRASRLSYKLAPPKRYPTSGFVGHDMSLKSPDVIRVLAFQGQSRMASPEPSLAAKRFRNYLRDNGVDLALCSETGMRDDSRELREFKSVLRAEFRYIVITHYPANAPSARG